jgi:hypothetical protein
MYYCGTCKTLGRSYGQRARLLLNHDTVFLAEILGALEGPPIDWAPAYQSFNCLAMPATTPPVLEYAAAATLILTKWKIADHIEDTGGRRWFLARRILDKQVTLAGSRLREWSFPLDQAEIALAEQSAREAGATSFQDVAGPTAEATALFFSHGAKLVYREDLANALGALGRSFGTLVYLLDAYEDFEHDLAESSFNALRALSLGREWAAVQLRALEANIIREMSALPLPGGFLEEAVSRLRANMAVRLGEPLPVGCRSRHLTWKERWADAVAIGRQMRDRENAQWLKGTAVLASVTAIAFWTPQWARSAQNWRECLSLSLNLMAAGSVFAMVSAPDPGHAKKAGWLSNCCGGCVPDSCDCGGCDC